MIYIFAFMGEFGVELINWQGVIRNFAKTISPNDQIVCCSRANLYPLYETASTYIDISELDHFKRGRASGYWAFPTRKNNWISIEYWIFERKLKAQIKSLVLNQLKMTNKIEPQDTYTFIFSSDRLILNGCQFGRAKRPVRLALNSIYRKLKATLPAQARKIDRLRGFLTETINPQGTYKARKDGDIYDLLDLGNNSFRAIEPDLVVSDSVEEKLGLSLTKPFVLCQTRQRDLNQLSKDNLPRDKLAQLITSLVGDVNVVLLSFHSGRWLDSYSQFEAHAGCFHFHCSSFPEQACLIHFAKYCLFFTEGDLGSHTYVPPMMGKDVTVIAPHSVYTLASAPIAFWNKNVFHFGGQMVAKTSEEVFSSEASLKTLVSHILTQSLA